MAQITAAIVKELRERTGAGMMDCKKALVATEGDMEKAIDFLREKGLSQAAKKAGRVAAEGAVVAYVTEDGKTGAIVEVNCETDFVGKNENFHSRLWRNPLLNLSLKPIRLMLMRCWLPKWTARPLKTLLPKPLPRLAKIFPYVVLSATKAQKAKCTAISMAAARLVFLLI